MNKIDTRGFQKELNGAKWDDHAVMTGHWEINLHGCWWEVSPYSYEDENYWVKGLYPVAMLNEEPPEHKCIRGDIDWDVYQPSMNPHYEKHEGGHVLWRNGKCKICNKLVRKVYRLSETYEQNNHASIDLK